MPNGGTNAILCSLDVSPSKVLVQFSKGVEVTKGSRARELVSGDKAPELEGAMDLQFTDGNRHGWGKQ